MELVQLIQALSKLDAYPHVVDKVDVCQTHISVVFLAGPVVYKIKKPVALGFLDFSTLDRRKHFCDEEVRLNRRLAPRVYLGVVPITESPHGLQVEGSGKPIEWAVKMERLPDEATFLATLQRGELSRDHLTRLAQRLAKFHAEASNGEEVARYGGFATVSANARDNLVAASRFRDVVTPTVLDRIGQRTEEELDRCARLIEARAHRGVPREGHGDLHLDHLYRFPDLDPPHDLAAIDCIEFSQRYRCCDPIADIAFVAMDLSFHGRRDLARWFEDAYLATADDAEGRILLPFYTAYRATVRGKVEGVKAHEEEIPFAERDRSRRRSQAYWLTALSELESPERRPILILIGGLPGTGKSTLAEGIAGYAGCEWLRTDVIRKGLAGLPPTRELSAEIKAEIYSEEWTHHTYAQTLQRAERLLLSGHRVIVDANFREESRRAGFFKLARQLAIPIFFFLCEAPPEVVRQRLESRQKDPSDADWAVYRWAAERWEPFEPEIAPRVVTISSVFGKEQMVQSALARLRTEEVQ